MSKSIKKAQKLEAFCKSKTKCSECCLNGKFRCYSSWSWRIIDGFLISNKDVEKAYNLVFGKEEDNMLPIEELNKAYETALQSINDIMAEMKANIKDFEKKQEEEKPSRRWKPKTGESFFFLYADGIINSAVWLIAIVITLCTH